MKNETWIDKARQKFKLFRQLEKLNGDCCSQEIDSETGNFYNEKWLLYPKDGGAQDVYFLQASKKHNSVHVFMPDGKWISITEINASGLPSIQINN